MTYRYPDGKEALRGVELIVSARRVGRPGRAQRRGQEHALAALERPAAGQGARRPGPCPRGGTDGTAASVIQADLASGSTGVAVSERTAPDIRRRVGLVFQDPDDQLFCNTVLEDVAFGPLNQGKSPAEARAIALDCLGTVELRALADRPPITSASASASAPAWPACWRASRRCSCSTSPPPTSTREPAGGSSRSFADLTCTKLIATHDLEMVLEVCPRTVVLDQGRVAAERRKPRDPG